jgi:release factor glutamine methyltransferase
MAQNLAERAFQAQRNLVLRMQRSSGTYNRVVGKTFRVDRNVFPPSGDTTLMAQLMRIRSGERVLEVGTGCGALAILAALHGGRVLAVDISPWAVACAKKNAATHMVESRVTVDRSDVFSRVKSTYDVVLANLPYTSVASASMVERCVWDPDHRANKRFWKQVEQHLEPGGRIYYTHGNFAERAAIEGYARRSGFGWRVIGRRTEGWRTYYLYQFERAP